MVGIQCCVDMQLLFFCLLSPSLFDRCGMHIAVIQC